MRAWVATLAMAGWAHSAFAAGYDDFTRAMTANLRGEHDTAITAFTAALNSGDLAPAYVPAIYRGRATAYLNRNRCQEALRDINTYGTLNPSEKVVIGLRLHVELCLKNLTAAQSNYTNLVGAEEGPYDQDMFATALWQYGYFAEAAEWWEKAFKGADKSEVRTVDFLLRHAMSAERAGTLDRARLAAGVEELKPAKLTDWGHALFDLFLGKIGPVEVLKEAEDWSAQSETAKTCEGEIYVAEWHFAHQNPTDATRYLNDAAEICARDGDNYYFARMELQRLTSKS